MAAALASRDSIDDDWEHLSNDSFSVISASTSADEAVDDESVHFDADAATNPQPSAVKSQLSSSADATYDRDEWPRLVDSFPSPRPAGLPTQDLSDPASADHTSEAKGKAVDTGRVIVEQQGNRHAKQEDDLPTDPFNAEEYQYESDDAVDELLDSHTNTDPAFFLNVLNSLSNIIIETIVGASELDTLGVRSPGIADACVRLNNQILELVPIVTAYARMWKTISSDIPLDPNLLGWMSGVRVKLLGLQADMQRVARQPSQGTRSTSSLDQYLKSLTEYGQQMNDFLPIIQADFNEFQTRRMNFPTPRPSIQPASPSGPPARTASSTSAHTGTAPIPIRNARPSPSSGVWILRREVYLLKDEVQRTIEQLSECVSSLPASGSSHVSRIVQTFGGLFNVISLVLSNHGSDWIENSLSGGLTYAEFTQLDVASVRDFKARLIQIWDVLEVEPSWTPEMVERHRRNVLLEEGQLDKLETLAEVLNAMFNPSRD